MIGVLVAAALCATPIRLDEVRAQSRQATPARLSELERLRAGEEVRLARAGLLPHLGFSLGTSYSWIGPQQYLQAVATGLDAQGNPVFEERLIDVPGSSRTNLNLSLGLTQSLFEPILWANLKAAGARYDASAEQAAEDRLNAELEGIRRFYELLRVQKALQVTQDRVTSSTELVDRAEALFQAGRRRKEDAISARINLGNDQMSLLSQRALRTQVGAQLAAWIQRPIAEDLDALAPPELSAPPAAVPTYDQALAAAKVHRPQLRALAALERAAAEAVGAARSVYLPSLTGGVSYNRNSQTPGPFFDITKQHSITGQLTLRWDLFSGFATSAEVSEAQLAEQRAALTLKQAELDVAADLRSRIDALASQREAVELARKNFELAKDNLQLAEIRFGEGAGSTVDIRDAQVKLSAADLLAFESRIDFEIARAGLERAIGALGQGVAQ